MHVHVHVNVDVDVLVSICIPCCVSNYKYDEGGNEGPNPRARVTIIKLTRLLMRLFHCFDCLS